MRLSVLESDVEPLLDENGRLVTTGVVLTPGGELLVMVGGVRLGQPAEDGDRLVFDHDFDAAAVNLIADSVPSLLINDMTPAQWRDELIDVLG
jgi:hypothetical protein